MGFPRRVIRASGCFDPYRSQQRQRENGVPERTGPDNQDRFGFGRHGLMQILVQSVKFGEALLSKRRSRTLPQGLLAVSGIVIFPLGK